MSAADCRILESPEEVTKLEMEVENRGSVSENDNLEDGNRVVVVEGECSSHGKTVDNICDIEVVLNVEENSNGMQGNEDNLKVADAEKLSEREDNAMATGFKKDWRGLFAKEKSVGKQHFF